MSICVSLSVIVFTSMLNMPLCNGNLDVPPTRTVRMGPRSFSVSGPTLWNSLPVELKTMQIPQESFKSKLKTYLFTKAYDQ